MRFTIDGKPVQASADIRTSLPDLLRDLLGLLGAKTRCDQGTCSACNVPIDGERINACLELAVPPRDRDFATVEELAQTDKCLNGADHHLPVSKIANSLLERGIRKTRWSALKEAIRDASQPGPRSVLPRCETTSL